MIKDGLGWYEWWRIDKMDMNDEGWIRWIWMMKEGWDGYECYSMDRMWILKNG